MLIIAPSVRSTVIGLFVRAWNKGDSNLVYKFAAGWSKSVATQAKCMLYMHCFSPDHLTAVNITVVSYSEHHLSYRFNNKETKLLLGVRLDNRCCHDNLTVLMCKKTFRRVIFIYPTLSSFCTVVPSILLPLENVTLLRGSKLNLTCLADGDPLPSIYWTKNGSSSIPHSHFSQGNSTLVISSVTIFDEGLYECTARSRAGNNSSKAHVEVQGMAFQSFRSTLQTCAIHSS